MSLRLRLTLWYTGILGGTLLLVSLIVYFTMAFTLDRQTNQFLNSRKDQYALALVRAGGPARGAALFANLIANFNPDTYAQLVGLDGQPITRTSNLPSGWPLDKSTIDRALSGVVVDETVRTGDVVLRIENFPISFEGQTIGVLQLGRDVTQAEASLTFLREMLVLANLAGLAASFGAGWLLARQALRPIGRIAQTAQDIGASKDFARRVEFAGSHDELGQLTTAFNDMLGHIQAAYHQIENALQAQRRFVADASHELRTPLTTIRGNIGLLRGPEVTSEDRRDALQDMASEAERMSRLVANLLVLARADAGLHLQKTPVPMGEVVRDVYRQARVLSDGVRLLVKDDQPAYVDGNPDYLKQLLLILVDNALKNTPAGGSVDVATDQNDGWVRLTVRDTGKV